MFVFVLMLVISFQTFALEYAKPFFNWDIYNAQPHNINGKNNFWTTADWVELKLSISAKRKITDISVVDSSGYQNFNQAQIDNLFRFERFVVPAKINGEYINSQLDYRVDYKHWHGLNFVKAEIEVLDSEIEVPKLNNQKDFLITVNRKFKEDVFRVKQVPIESGLVVYEIDQYFVNSEDYGYVKNQADSFEQLENNFLISQMEFQSAIRAYSSGTRGSIGVFDGRVMTTDEANELLAYDQKLKYRFTRYAFKTPDFGNVQLFANYNAELALSLYTGRLEVTATVLASGKVVNVSITQKSKHDRVNAIVIEALEKSYIMPAYANFMPITDKVKLSINFFQDH